MTNQPRLFAPARSCCIALVGALGVFLPSLRSQTAPAPATTKRVPTPSELIKYDKNANGVLEADEQAAFEAGEKTDAILLTPFEVSTSQDRGYAAGNTLSGGRMDTPLAITPGSISVMTKEFMDDFALTDINEAAAWTLSMEPAGGAESGPFGGNRFQANFRGAGTGSASYPSRNGNLQYFVADSYNTERFEFQRGPNAALFGDAGPGGMQGSSGKQARFGSKATRTDLRVDSFGGYRATIDTSYGLDRVAFRVNALHQNTKSYQDGTTNKQNGITLTGAYKIAANTVLRAELERSAEWNVLYRKTYGENASLWDRTTVNDTNTAIANSGTFGLSTYGSATQDRYVWNFGTNSLINYRGIQYQTNGLGFQIPWAGRPEFANFKPGMDKKFFLGPADAIADRDLNARAVTLDHRFTPNLFAQIQWTSSDVDPVALYSQGLPGDYRIDVNRLLPTGETNPNFGKAYSEFGQNSQYQQNGVEEARFIVNYSFEQPRWFGMKQRFVVNGGWRQDLYEAWSRAWRRTNNIATVAAPTNGQNTLNFRIYYDRPRPSIAPILKPGKLNVDGMTWENVDSGFGADNDRRLTYGQVVSQTSFLDERVGLTLSFRRDRNEDDTVDSLGQYLAVAPFTQLYGKNGVVGAHGFRTTYKNSQSAGVVAYPFPRQWRWLAPLGFTVNYSQNFSVPNTGNPTMSGQNPSPPVATTKDFGVRFSVPNGVAYATLSHYNTEQTGQLITFGSAGQFRTIYTNLGYTDSALISNSAFNYRDTSDRKLEGWEFEVTANPSRNLTLTANYSHPIVTTIADSPDRRAFYAANKAEYQAGAAAQTGQVVNGRTILDPIAIQTAIQQIEDSFNGFTPGTLANNVVKHSINVSGRYSFTEGKLRGLAITGGVNYRAHRKVGSRDAVLKFNLQRAATVAETAQAAYDYLWVDPTWSTTIGANYTRRIGRYSARFQINITNLLNDNDPQWSSYGIIQAGQLNNAAVNNVVTVPNGNNRMQVLSGFSQLDPRKVTFTTSLSF
ncbi:MAG: TonB-dependent receptor [Opitutaceae bacterium]